MPEELPIQRLSPKNQVTLLRGARGLPQVEELPYICGLPHKMLAENGTAYPVIVLMTEQELEVREERIRADAELSNRRKERLIAQLNGNVRQLSVDGQRRVVLPPHFVRYVGVEDRRVFMYSSNTSVLIWKPEDWSAYNHQEEDDDSLLLMI